MTIKKRNAIRTEDYVTAEECSEKIKDLKFHLHSGDSLGGYTTQEELVEAMDKMKGRETMNKEAKRHNIRKLIQDLNGTISKNEGWVENEAGRHWR